MAVFRGVLHVTITKLWKIPEEFLIFRWQDGKLAFGKWPAPCKGHWTILNRCWLIHLRIWRLKRIPNGQRLDMTFLFFTSSCLLSLMALVEKYAFITRCFIYIMALRRYISRTLSNFKAKWPKTIGGIYLWFIWPPEYQLFTWITFIQVVDHPSFVNGFFLHVRLLAFSLFWN